MCRRISPDTRCRARSFSSMSFRVTRRARCSSASWSNTSWATDRAMAELGDYGFGSLTVDGERHTRDLIVLPDRVVPDWWRREGHSLAMEDLDEVIDELPERLILGCGAHGRLEPPQAGLGGLRARGV